MNRKIQPWEWPNILALDAAVIAVAWQWVFAHFSTDCLSPSAHLVLGLSVWLTYAADRLFDVSRRSEHDLLSNRHRFAKRQHRPLWAIWLIILSSNIALALCGLTPGQLEDGFMLLGLCLAYTFLNQKLSKHFFPKELFVSIIFIGGTQVFLQGWADSRSILSFGLICFLNCIMIARKEQTVDLRLGVRSLSFLFDERLLTVLFVTAFAIALFSLHFWILGPTILGLALIFFFQRSIPSELFRVLSDATLLIGPTIYFFFESGTLVR